MSNSSIASTAPDFRALTEEWSDHLALLRQNRLLSTSSFYDFCRGRGLSISSTDPDLFLRRGWLIRDAANELGEPLFHPFRFCTVAHVLSLCKLRIATSATAEREGLPELLDCVVGNLITFANIADSAREWNRVIDLAILLEPVFWPRVVGWHSRTMLVDEESYRGCRAAYTKKVQSLVADLNESEWRKLHETLRVEAAWMDNNSYLYLLLRVADWDERKRLTGSVSGALWIRHVAEAIRRAFEEIDECRWPEEDEAFGSWTIGGRRISFGSDRPLDDPTTARAYLVSDFGLATGPVVRWYVEGETEFSQYPTRSRTPTVAGSNYTTCVVSWRRKGTISR